MRNKNTELYLKLVALEGGMSASETMLKANQLAVANGEDVCFTPTEIGMCTLTELLRGESQRTKDFVMVTNFFERSYHVLHVEVTLNQLVSDQDRQQVLDVYSALVRLEKAHLFTDNLRPKAQKWLQSLVNKSSEHDNLSPN